MISNRNFLKILARRELFKYLSSSSRRLGSNFCAEVSSIKNISPLRILKKDSLKLKEYKSNSLEDNPTLNNKTIVEPLIGIDQELSASKSNIKDIKNLKLEVEKCNLCSLSSQRNKVVFGEGSNAIPLVVIGEAPGEQEDQQGKPFVGRSGELLTKMLKAIDINRDQIYICNVLKCRPPLNRDPSNEEISKCSEYLDKQLSLLKPHYILALGRIAAQRLLDKEASMKYFREAQNSYQGIPVIVTYHPSALLRNSAWKRYAWEDLKKLRRLLQKSNAYP